MPRSDIIAVLDLETTGSEVEKDEIIEVGIVFKSWPDWETLLTVSEVVMPSDTAFVRMMKKDVVRKMHLENGLIDDIVAGGVSVAQAEDNILDALNVMLEPRVKNVAEMFEHIPLSGSGVSHFDRPFLKKYMPNLSARFTYWHLDVGSTRRMYDLAGVPGASDDAKTHRALDDAMVHADQLMHYVNDIKRLAHA